MYIVNSSGWVMMVTCNLCEIIFKTTGLLVVLSSPPDALPIYCVTFDPHKESHDSSFGSKVTQYTCVREGEPGNEATDVILIIKLYLQVTIQAYHKDSTQSYK